MKQILSRSSSYLRLIRSAVSKCSNTIPNNVRFYAIQFHVKAIVCLGKLNSGFSFKNNVECTTYTIEIRFNSVSGEAVSRPHLITVYTSVARHHDKRLPSNYLQSYYTVSRWKVSHINLRTCHNFRFLKKIIET